MPTLDFYIGFIFGLIAGLQWPHFKKFWQQLNKK